MEENEEEGLDRHGGRTDRRIQRGRERGIRGGVRLHVNSHQAGVDHATHQHMVHNNNELIQRAKQHVCERGRVCLCVREKSSKAN